MLSGSEYASPSWIRRGHLRWVWGLWEPLRLYRRSAHMAAYSPGNSHWAEAWYERMHSEEMVAKLAEMGVNCISTHFFKGFGLVAEAEEMERAARLTELCHRYGIRVLGYCQWATICYETFLDEVPGAEEWVQRDAEGKLLLYSGSTYWRWLGCQRHGAYADYLSEVVRKCISEAGMDGVEWDGTVYKCHCPLCQEAFRDYLTATYDRAEAEEYFGLPHFRHVRIPSTESRIDPLYLELLDFRREFMAERLAAFNTQIKDLGADVAQVTYDMLAGPAGPPDNIDLLVDENHDECFVGEDGVLTTKFRGLKHAYALDRVVLSTGWLRAPSRSRAGADPSFETEAEVAAFGAPAGGLRRPETPAEVARDVAECAMYGGHMITPTWATRSIGGDRAAFEQPDLYACLRRYLHFFRDHEFLFESEESLATVAVYRGFHALKCDFFRSFPAVFGMEQICLQHHIPFDMLFTYQLERLDRYRAVVLAEQTCLSAAEVAAFRVFAQQGGGLVVTGSTGLYDERNRHRNEHPFRDLFGLPGVRFLADAPEKLSRPTRDHPPAYHDMHLPEGAADIADAIRAVADRDLPFVTDAGPFVALEAYRLRDGRCAVHLLNYRNEEPVSAVRVELGDSLSAERAELFTPDGDRTRLEVDSRHTFTVGHLQTYAIVILA
jgi:hypothetical protein